MLVPAIQFQISAEANPADTFKNPAMLRRLNDITNLPDTDKEQILYTIDHLLASVKTKLAYKQ